MFSQAGMRPTRLIFGSKLRHGAEGAQHAGRAAHVELHLVHLGRRLDGDAAGVERDALAHQHDRRLSLRGARVAQHDEARRLVGALRHGQERAHAELLGVLAVQHFHLDAELLAEALGRPARKLGVQWLAGRLAHSRASVTPAATAAPRSSPC
jgi:hypothetical protein